MFKLKAGKYRLQVERERPGILFVQVIQREHGRMVWNQLPPDSRLGECVRAALRVLDSLRGRETPAVNADRIVEAVMVRFAT